MTYSLRRVYAIFQKDLKDVLKNMFITTSLPVPLVFALIASRDPNPPVEAHFMFINLVLVMITAFLQSAIIAEEKEKNTLRGLMLSPATTLEILNGKSLLTFVFTIVTIMVGAAISGYEPANLWLVAVAFLFSIFFYLALGTLIGLYTKSMMEASVLLMPILLVFGFGTMHRAFIEEYAFLSFTEYFPNIQLLELAENVQTGAGIADVWPALTIILAWSIVMFLLVIIVFKRREIDE
ncbi:ABC transporter permease [Thalassobacillus sp. CUG 92003]|uniref:ABC transporter permease n=1 Tax=Thalassobacillus sp. CUG 92003 TaxID=2736641 RepID=UPI0015E6FA45|nr:ABC transporter permease [Thalassobacillus sp. CUG 92003]